MENEKTVCSSDRSLAALVFDVVQPENGITERNPSRAGVSEGRLGGQVARIFLGCLVMISSGKLRLSSVTPRFGRERRDDLPQPREPRWVQRHSYS